MEISARPRPKMQNEELFPGHPPTRPPRSRKTNVHAKTQRHSQPRRNKLFTRLAAALASESPLRAASVYHLKARPKFLLTTLPCS